jgi:SAM-dependent methyltransferase
VAVKQRVLNLLRKARLIDAADAARFRWLALGSAASRAAFARRHGAVPLPPDDVSYDAYGSLDWEFYWGFGQLIAGFLAERLRARSATGRVLEWGCGPARIVRHVPALLGPGWEVYGSDANRRTIEWCAAHLPEVRFSVNQAAPPLSFPSGAFDGVYAVSVFTHLPEGLHRPWVDELRRVLTPGGLLMCTLNGEATRPLLLPEERERFDAAALVVRGGVPDGTRCFLAYHPPAYVAGDLLRGFEVIEHLPAPNLFGARQDVWIARAI